MKTLILVVAITSIAVLGAIVVAISIGIDVARAALNAFRRSLGG